MEELRLPPWLIGRARTARARAYAATGDPCASDPLCPYQPAPQAEALDAPARALVI